MDPFLAEFFGTGTSDEELQKVAQLQLLEKIAEEEGVDLSELSPEEVNAILEEAQAEEGAPAEEGGEEEVPTEEEVKEAQEKLAEATYIGKIIAHSYWNEMENIQKEAGWAGNVVRGGKRVARRVGRAIGGAASTVQKKTQNVGARMLGVNKGEMGRASRGARAATTALGAAPFAAGAGALGAGGYYGYKALKNKKEKEKQSAALVERRAIEFLADAGLVDQAGNIVPPASFQKVASDESVDRAALQYLESLGYPVTWYR